MTGTCTPRVGYTRSTACAALTMLSEHNASQSYLLTVVTYYASFATSVWRATRATLGTRASV